ncbi:hypothetical protein GH733_010922 [Mirounga leonina]|nr:hypothetical protein GH733_010922 [Mirounga leonina]
MPYRKKGWPDHKWECKCLKSCKPRYPPDSVRLLGRMEETPSESEKLYSFYDLESNINKMTEDKKEGLRQLVMTFQHFMREEIQDASQLPPSFDIFEAFAKGPVVSLIDNKFMGLVCTYISRMSRGWMQDCGTGLLGHPSRTATERWYTAADSLIHVGSLLSGMLHIGSEEVVQAVGGNWDVLESSEIPGEVSQSEKQRHGLPPGSFSSPLPNLSGSCSSIHWAHPSPQLCIPKHTDNLLQQPIG